TLLRRLHPLPHLPNLPSLHRLNLLLPIRPLPTLLHLLPSLLHLLPSLLRLLPSLLRLPHRNRPRLFPPQIRPLIPLRPHPLRLFLLRLPRLRIRPPFHPLLLTFPSRLLRL